jgi:small GTP-binding protein
MSNSAPPKLKVVLVGDAKVGKTSILLRLSTGSFRASLPPTVGVAFQNHLMVSSTGSSLLHIWDTAGQEQYRSLAPMFFRSADVAVLVFDLTERDSFSNLDQWVTELTTNGPPNMKVVLAGNKCDKAHDVIIERVDADRFRADHSLAAYFETSAKDGSGIAELFGFVADLTPIEHPLDGPVIALSKTEDPESSCC